jgi:hypothetical protein
MMAAPFSALDYRESDGSASLAPQNVLPDDSPSLRGERAFQLVDLLL